MQELTPQQIAVLERVLQRGFQPVPFALYPNAIGLRRGGFAALLEPVAGGAFRQLGPAFYMMDGNLSVRISRGSREYFTWKSRQIEVTPALIGELAQFNMELSESLNSTGLG